MLHVIFIYMGDKKAQETTESLPVFTDMNQDVKFGS